MNEDWHKPARNFVDDCSRFDTSAQRKCWERIYKIKFGDDIIITWKDDMISQIDFGSDVLIQQIKTGRKYSIDNKLRINRHFKRQQWTIELFHHYYKDSTKQDYLGKKEGWLYCSTADYIFYGTLNQDETEIIEVCSFSLIPFKDEEFKTKITPLYIVWASTQYNNSFQLTGNAIMTREFLESNAHKFWYWVEDKNNLKNWI